MRNRTMSLTLSMTLTLGLLAQASPATDFVEDPIGAARDHEGFGRGV